MLYNLLRVQETLFEEMGRNTMLSDSLRKDTNVLHETITVEMEDRKTSTKIFALP